MNVWEQVRLLLDRPLRTLDRRREFRIDVVRDSYAVVIPHGGEARLIRRQTIEQAAAMRAAAENLSRAQLQEAIPSTPNASYILAIVEEIS